MDIDPTSVTTLTTQQTKLLEMTSDRYPADGVSVGWISVRPWPECLLGLLVAEEVWNTSLHRAKSTDFAGRRRADIVPALTPLAWYRSDVDPSSYVGCTQLTHFLGSSSKGYVSDACSVGWMSVRRRIKNYCVDLSKKNSVHSWMHHHCCV